MASTWGNLTCCKCPRKLRPGGQLRMMIIYIDIRACQTNQSSLTWCRRNPRGRMLGSTSTYHEIISIYVISNAYSILYTDILIIYTYYLMICRSRTPHPSARVSSAPCGASFIGLTRPHVYVYDHHSQLAAGMQLPRTFAACPISPSRCH